MHQTTHTQSVTPRDQAVFTVDSDDTLGRLIALFLHTRLFGKESDKASPPLREMGWEDSLVAEMGSMPINDVAKLLSGPSACLGVVFDHRKAAAVVSSYRALKRDESDLDYFITNGATPALIRSLFPTVSARCVAQRRKTLGCESRGGRPPMPTAELSYAIYRCWQTLCAEETNARRRYKRLKEQFPQFTLATLSAAIEAT